jgi:steroid delta-isomerase-like uncharacterized protein
MRALTIEDLRSHLDAWFQAFNDHDPEAILAMCTEDVVWEDPGLPAPLTGEFPVADFLCQQFTAFPDLHIRKEEIEIYRSLDGKRAAASWHMVVTMTGRLDPPGLEPTGLTGDVTGMCRYEFGESGLIVRHQTVYDTLALWQRLGLMPSSASLPYRVLVGLQQADQIGRKFIRNLRH